MLRLDSFGEKEKVRGLSSDKRGSLAECKICVKSISDVVRNIRLFDEQSKNLLCLTSLVEPQKRYTLF